MMDIGRATSNDVEALVTLETKLFRDDSGIYDSFGDVTWPEREGRADFLRLLADEDSLVLVARDSDAVVGHLVGYVTHSSPTRLPAKFAELRSLYVEEQWRRRGAGRLLVEHFVSWARNLGCAQAHVDSYSANLGAQEFYEGQGFTSRTVTRALQL